MLEPCLSSPDESATLHHCFRSVVQVAIPTFYFSPMCFRQANLDGFAGIVHRIAQEVTAECTVRASEVPQACAAGVPHRRCLRTLWWHGLDWTFHRLPLRGGEFRSCISPGPETEVSLHLPRMLECDCMLPWATRCVAQTKIPTTCAHSRWRAVPCHQQSGRGATFSQRLQVTALMKGR